MKVLETRYAGRRFRSRLEARWAVVFDELKVAWEYEPEGFETEAGWYLPDFRVELCFPFPTWTWFEVKPQGASEDPRHKAFAAAGEFLTVARGLPRDYDEQYRRDWLTTYAPDGASMRVGLFAFEPGRVTTFGASLSGHDSRMGREVTAAYAAALSARFEHDERWPR